MTSLGILRLVVSKILNHAESGVTAVYDLSATTQRSGRPSFVGLASLEEVLDGGMTSSNVVRIA